MIFTTKAEALDALDDVRSAVERLPVVGMTDLNMALHAIHVLAGAIGATVLVDPADAVGTIRYLEAHGLIEEGIQ